MLACLCLLACSCSPLALLWLFPGMDRLFAWTNERNGCTGLHLAPVGIAVSLHARTHGTGMTAIGPRVVSGRSETFWQAASHLFSFALRFETFWQADGLNAQPDRLKRLYGA